MDALEFERQLRLRAKDVEVVVDRPDSPTSSWFIDARLAERAIVIEWRPQVGFGLSEIRGDALFGESLPDEFFRDGQRALDRALELLVPQFANAPASP